MYVIVYEVLETLIGENLGDKKEKKRNEITQPPSGQTGIQTAQKRKQNIFKHCVFNGMSRSSTLCC